MIKQIVLICFSLLFIFNSKGHTSWELYDQVIAVVNDIPIVESELNKKLDYETRRKSISRSRKKYTKSRILDELIENAILLQTAKDEAIVISDERVMTYLEKIMNPYLMKKIRVKDPDKFKEISGAVSKRILDQRRGEKLKKNKRLDRYVGYFKNYISTKNKMAFDDYFDELKVQLRKEQIISIAIGVSPPTKEEAKRWYYQNRQKLGYEIHVKHILITAKRGSLTEQRRAYKKLEEIRKKILNGASFEKMARKYSQDRGSAVKGGDIGWMHISALDPYFAGNVHKMNKKGQISEVFKSSFGYHIAKYLGRKTASFETMERMIMYKLHEENLKKQYVKWVAMKKEAADIKIFMKSYIKQ